MESRDAIRQRLFAAGPKILRNATGETEMKFPYYKIRRIQQQGRYGRYYWNVTFRWHSTARHLDESLGNYLTWRLAIRRMQTHALTNFGKAI